jgi:hypothetical protein
MNSNCGVSSNFHTPECQLYKANCIALIKQSPWPGTKNFFKNQTTFGLAWQAEQTLTRVRKFFGLGK